MMLRIGLNLLMYMVHVFLSIGLVLFVTPQLASTEVLGNSSTKTSDQDNTNEIKVENNKLSICIKEVCVKESAEMVGSLDESVNPCDDFYDFACGKFIRDTVLQENKAIEISFTQLQDKVNAQLHQILTEAPQPNEPNSFKLAKIFRTSCMNETARNEIGITQMLEILEKYGGWPVVSGDWNSEKWNWINISNDGLFDAFILKFGIVVDLTNSSKRVIAIEQPMLGISQEFLLRGIDDENVKAYYNFMVDAAVIFGADESNAKAELLAALRFEIELAKIILPAEMFRIQSSLYNSFTIQQLQVSFPYINWLEYINWNLKNELHVDETEIVIVTDTNYVLQLNTILQSTPKRTVANYFAWRSVLAIANLLNNVLHQRNQQFLAKNIGILKADPRETECTKLTMQYLPISVAAPYVRKYFDVNLKKSATDLVNNVQAEFLKTLNKVDWMDDDSRNLAIEKAKNIQHNIAYPVEILDNKILEQYYQGLKLETNSLLHNVLRICDFNRKLSINKLRKSVNRTDWEEHSMPFLINAWYSTSDNSIELPAAILQDRFFSADRPSYMNYAAIGWFVGHEISHGFDDEGRQFDKNGNLVDWWQSETVRKFVSKVQCIIDQYSNYTDPKSDLRVNGINTQGENIADIAGVKGSYAAYQSFVKRNGPEPILPGLNYTQNQLFWISAAQVWCAATRPEYDIKQYTTDLHAPSRFRIIGTFSNMKSFSSDFSCTPGTKMNPTNKCEIW